MRCSGKTSKATRRRDNDESNDGYVQQSPSLASETYRKRDREHSNKDYPDEKSDIVSASSVW
ncbi:MAG: hypothetical protein L0154_29000 [Chloroflexi bacterium]|nr:hypothetical protein [Chloroflexota bacterium]